MMEPMDGYLRCKVYVYNDDIRGEISFRSYSDFVKIGPHDTDSSFEVFKYFINEFESKVCKLELLGGLEEIETTRGEFKDRPVQFLTSRQPNVSLDSFEHNIKLY